MGTDSLSAHSPTTYLYFDSYNAPDGAVGRLYSDCFDIPASSSGYAQVNFWMSHDTLFQASAPDSMYVVVSTDHGVTWNRLTGFARIDPAFTPIGWRQDSVNLSAYAGQTIQIGFEAAGHFGNIMGIDDITVQLISPVPVSLLNFTAKRTGRTNLLNWSTSQEINTNKFVIEKSTDGRTFTQLGELNASGNSSTTRNYVFTDNYPIIGINYYRLRLVDRDNSFKYSDVRTVRNNGAVDLSIFPNPVHELLNVTINSDDADRGQMSISDLTGKTIYSQPVVIAQGVNTLPVDMNKMAKGSYIVKVQLTSGILVTQFNRQ
jgi:hypothetical protein